MATFDSEKHALGLNAGVGWLLCTSEDEYRQCKNQ